MSRQSLYLHRQALFIGCSILWFSGICPAGTIQRFGQIQEQVVTGSPVKSLIYDSGQLSRTSLAHAIGLGIPCCANAGGSISGNDIQGVTQAQEGQAFMDAFWQDGITVGGLAPGTPVSLMITNSLTSHVFVEGTGHAIAISDLRLFLNNPLDLILCNSAATDGGGPCNTLNGTQTASHLVTLLSGDPAPFVLDEELQISVVSSGIAAEADAPNDIFIDVLTPGATLTTESGVNYSSTTATPEPAMALPLLVCLAGFVIHRKRGRRRFSNRESEEQ